MARLDDSKEIKEASTAPVADPPFDPSEIHTYTYAGKIFPFGPYVGHSKSSAAEQIPEKIAQVAKDNKLTTEEAVTDFVSNLNDW